MSLVSKAFSDIVTFSRSSNATRVGPTGLVEYAPHNLLLRSQEFDNASWIKTNSGGGSAPVVTANAATAPDGTVTADQVVFAAPVSGDQSLIYQAPSTSAGTYTGSFYIKASTAADVGKIIGFRHVQGSGYLFVTLTNSWVRVTLTEARLTDNFEIILRPALGTSSGTVTIHLWGAQLSVGPYALDYTPTTSAAVYGPRFDYNPVTLAARGLLVEEQRTNLLTYSEDITQWSVAGGSRSSNTAVSPDGQTTADTYTQSSGGDYLYHSAAISSSTTYTLSVFLKAGTKTTARLWYATGGIGTYVFIDINLSAGTIGSVSSGGGATAAAASIQAFGNGWYRVALTGNLGANTVGYLVLGNDSTSGGVYIWGAQLEAGSFATSYLPTLASSVTRSADVASVNTLSPWFNATEGTLFIEANMQDAAGAGINYGFASFNDGSVNNEMLFYKSSGGAPADARFATVVSGSLQGDIDSGLNLQDNVVFKIAGCFKLNDFAVSANGLSVQTDTVSQVPTVNNLQIASSRFAGVLNGHVGDCTQLVFTRERG